MATAEQNARDLLGRLSPDLPTPEWIDEANGAIGLDWNLSVRRQLSVDVHDTYLDVAAFIDEQSGASRFAYNGGPIPEPLLDLLRQLIAPL